MTEKEQEQLMHNSHIRLRELIGLQTRNMLNRDTFDAAYVNIKALRDAAIDFVAKVESGQAHSIRSYKKFKDALSLGENN